MPKQALTDLLVSRSTSKGKPQHEYYDAACPGLLLRVTCAGHRTWGFVFKNPTDGKRTRMTLGVYSETAKSLKVARVLASVARAKVEARKDPRIAESAPAPGKTIRELFADRVTLVIRAKKRPFKTADEIEWRYGKYILPKVGDVEVKAFEVEHYNMVVDDLVRAGSTRMAGILHDDLKALLKFGVKRGVIRHSPLMAVDDPDDYKPRARFLTVEEIMQVWNGLPCALPKSAHARAILKLCLALGQRVGEVTGMRKSELDLQSNQPRWTIPAARVKNGDTHVVPLNGLALEIIRDAVRDADGDVLFLRRDGKGPINADTVSQFVLLAHKRGGFSGMERWTPHDLRRTVGTQMLNKKNGMGISRFDKALVLNHRSVTKANVSDIVYDQNEYFDEKADALNKWGAFLEALISCDEPIVTTMPAAECSAS